MDKSPSLLSRVLVGAVGFTVILIVGFGAMSFLVSLREEPEQRNRPVFAPAVEIQKVVKEQQTFFVDTQGSVAARTETTLVPQVSGEIIRVSDSLYAGGFFRKGDVLLQVDPRDYQTRLAEARSRLAQSELALEQERAQVDQARRDWQALGTGDGSPLVLREPQLRQAEANAEAARANVAQAERDLERTEIRAPYDGIVR